MTDVAERRGVSVDAARLGDSVGVPVVVLDPRRRAGTRRLETAVGEALHAPVPAARDRDAETDLADELAVADERFAWIDEATTAGSRVRDDVAATPTDRVDRWATAPSSAPCCS
jgi:ferrous iron transport protein B